MPNEDRGYGYGYEQNGAQKNQTPPARENGRQKKQIAYRRWAGKNIFSVATLLESKATSNNRPLYVDTVFFEMDEVGAGHKIRMQGNTTDLRALSHACKELVFSGVCKYRYFTDPSASNFAAGGEAGKKSLSLSIQPDGTCFINMIQNQKTLSVSFLKQELLALSDQLVVMAELTEKSLYKLQSLN